VPTRFQRRRVEQPRKFWLDKIKESTLGLTVAGAFGLLVGVASTTEAIDKLAVWTGLKANALQLAKADEKAAYSTQLTRAAWHRLFLMRRYVLAVKSNFSEGDRAKEWDKYSISLEAWNRDLMVNILSLSQYYGEAKRNEFENTIQPAFGKIHYCLEGLRYPSSGPICKVSSTRDIAAIERALDSLNGQLYCFVSGLPDRDVRCQ